jgi:hypothetical protein
MNNQYNCLWLSALAAYVCKRWLNLEILGQPWKTLVNLGTNLGKPWSTLVLDDVVRYGRCADTKTGYNLNADALHTIATTLPASVRRELIEHRENDICDSVIRTAVAFYMYM